MGRDAHFLKVKNCTIEIYPIKIYTKCNSLPGLKRKVIKRHQKRYTKTGGVQNPLKKRGETEKPEE